MTGRSEARLLRFLRGGPVVLCPAARPGRLLLDGGDRGALVADAGTLRGLLDAGLAVREGDRLRLAAVPPPDPPPPARIQGPDGAVADVLVNPDESPLAALMRRRARDGTPFLAEAEFRAGERLRADYSRGGLVPRLGMNWTAPVKSGRRAGGLGVAELTDAALGARRRVEAALAAVGPELSGVLVDVCCFLKGLEQVEAERGWPVRSAKIVLKSALSALARHYDPQAARERGGAGPILGWGAPGYRPERA